MRRLFVGAAVLALVLAAAGCKIVSTPTAPNGWYFTHDDSPAASGSGYYVAGPATPPVGRGSALLSSDATAHEGIATLQYQGLALSTINKLVYSTYQASSVGSPHETPTIQFDVDYDSTDDSTAFQGRIVYVPAAGGGTILPNQWQAWDTENGDAKWYSSGSGDSSFRPIVGGSPQANPPCTQASYCSYATILAHYPHARVTPSTGQLMVRTNETTSGFVGAVDNVQVGFGTTEADYDFDPGDGHIAVNSTTAAGLGFAFAQETATGSGSFVTGPNGADGSGSANLTVNDAGGEFIGTNVFQGTPFSDISFLSYKTYTPTPSSNAPTIQFDADYDNTDATTVFQGRVVFEPSQSGISGGIKTETWQTWNPLTAPSGWWSTGTPLVGNGTGPKPCTQATPCSFATLRSTYPNLSIRPITGEGNGQPVAGGVYLKAGGGWTGGFNGNVDSLTMAVNNGGVNGTVDYDLGG
jgi:hypothetical protein